MANSTMVPFTTTTTLLLTLLLLPRLALSNSPPITYTFSNSPNATCVQEHCLLLTDLLNSCATETDFAKCYCGDLTWSTTYSCLTTCYHGVSKQLIDSDVIDRHNSVCGGDTGVAGGRWEFPGKGKGGEGFWVDMEGKAEAKGVVDPADGGREGEKKGGAGRMGVGMGMRVWGVLGGLVGLQLVI